MRIFDYIPVPANFNIFNISCSHVGSSLCHKDGIREMIDAVRSPFEGVKQNFVVHHGDWIEGRVVDDPLFDHCTSPAMTIDQQIYQAIKLFKPIARNIVVGLEGNHDRYARKYSKVAYRILQGLGIPQAFGTYSSRIHWYNRTTNNLIFKQFATHGKKSIGSTSPDPEREWSNMKFQLQRHLYKKAADCLLMTKGHTHKLFHKEPIPILYLKDEDGRIKQGYVYVNRERQTMPYIIPDMRWYANVGAFYKAYKEEVVNFYEDDDENSVQTSYVEANELDPVELGYSVCVVRDERIVGIREVVV